MTTLANLPIEVMIDILSRLSLDSLFRFISVSKFWNVLINDPINSSLLQHKHILFMRLRKDSDSRKTQLILSDFTLNPSMSIFNDFHLPLPLDWNQSAWSFTGDQMPFRPLDDDIDFYNNFHIHDHSHGLVCLTDYHRNVVLCNPTTREFRKLPPSLTEITDPLDYIYDVCGIAIGFGYDSKSKDFKVVRLVCYDVGTIYWRAEIFDLSNDRWRDVEVPAIHAIEVPSFGVYHEGTLFWMRTAIFNESYIRTLYSFDMSEEVFGQIPFPESIEEMEIRFYYWNHIKMGVLNGSIVIFHYSWQNNHSESTLAMWELDLTADFWKLESTLDIWKMEKNDESGVVSWSKSFTISLNSEIKKPLMFVDSNQFLMIKEGRVVLYKIKTQQFKEFPIEGHACEAMYFVKSLFSVKGEYY